MNSRENRGWEWGAKDGGIGRVSLRGRESELHLKTMSEGERQVKFTALCNRVIL